MDKKIVYFLILVLSLLMPTVGFANAGPVYLESYPSFSVAPIKDTPITVERETLVFAIDERISDMATVTATYTLANPTEEELTVPMIFPFISEGYRGESAKIQFNGQEVDYKIFGAGHVHVRDYLRETVQFKEQVHMDAIIENLNQPLYEAKYFDDTAETTLYEVTFGEPADRQSRVTFTVDRDKTRVLTFGFSGFDISENGDCAVSSYVDARTIGEKGYILVLGEDTLTNVQSNDDVITRSSVKGGAFIRDKLVNDETGWIESKTRDMENLYGMFIKEVDNFFAEFQTAFSYDMVMENMFYGNNLAVFLYEVEFAPDSTNTMTVTYPMRATIDRENSRDYVNTFAYILNPAQNFKEFGGIDIHIELNSASPYIIESSLPLDEVEPGIYTLSLAGLPDEDLVFSTYPSAEITFLDRTAAQILPRGYGGMLLAFMVGFLVLAAAIVFLVFKGRRKNLH